MIGGRSTEIEGLERLWARACDGDGASLALVGETGTGVSTLVRLIAERAHSDGARVVAIDGARGEETVAWGGVSQIVQRLRPWPTSLPTRQTRRLEAVVGAPGDTRPTSDDRAAMWQALLALVTESSTAAPLLLTVDDLHWVDRESLEALRFVARRLSGSRVALVVGGRSLGELDLPDVTVIEPLSPEDSLTVVRDLQGDDPISITTARRIVDDAGGNPALLRAIVGSLTIDQRRGLAPLPVPLPGGALLDHEAGSVVLGLPEPSRRALAALAMSDQATASLEAVLSVAGCSSDDIAFAERAGIVEVWHADVGFVRPIHHLVAYWSYPAPDRRVLHARWAQHVDDDLHRLLHLSQSTIGSDDALAHDLDRLAIDAAERGDHVVALQSSVHARSLHADVGGQAMSALTAAESAITIGDITAARALIDTVTDTIDPARRRAVRAAIAEADGDPVGAADMWRDAIDRSRQHDVRRTVRSLVELCLVHIRNSEVHSVLDTLDDVEPGLGDVTGIERIQLDILRGVAEISSGRIDASTIARTARYVELLALDDEQLTPHLTFVATAVAMPLAHFRQHDEARAVAERCERIAAGRGMITIGPAVATARCLCALRGDLPGAAMYGALAVRLADEIGHHALALIAENYLLTAEAHLGLPQTLEHVERVTASGDLGRQLAAAIATSGYWLTMGRPERALEVAESIDVPPTAALVTSSRWLADLGEAAARCGRRELARSAVGRMRALPGVESDHWLIGAIERVEGMLADSDQCGDHFARSVEAFEMSTNTMSVARSELLWGERLRRARRRAAARPHLERARQLFTEIGAGRWIERAENELLAAGAVGVAPDHTRDAERVLTPQELQVARLAVSGASYREIANRLFVSPRTVETHLSSVYRKLGVRNRAELSARAAGDPALRSPS